jgi:hypothetical protein
MIENKRNQDVTVFLDGLNHPFRKEIELLRTILLSVDEDLVEGIKWNGPNYSIRGEDRITMRIHPPTQVQLIFHRGAKVKVQPEKRLLDNDDDFLTWKENDRAIASFQSLEQIEKDRSKLKEIATMWIKATM